MSMFSGCMFIGCFSNTFSSNKYFFANKVLIGPQDDVDNIEITEIL